MTEAEKSFPSETIPAEGHFAGNHPRVFAGALFVAAAVAVVAYLGWMYVQAHMNVGATVAPSSTAVVVQLEERITAIEQKTQSLENRLNELSGRVDKNASAPVNAEPQPAPAPAAIPAVDAGQMTQMQGNLTALSAALATLQTEVKQTGNTAAQTQQSVQNSLAAAVAFIPLREVAATGRGFASELAALRGVAGNGFQEPLTRLDPYAAKGAPTVDELREEFYNLEAPASVALGKATAQNWHERLLADLKGLISIRPLHGGGAPENFSAAETALASGDLSTALDAIKDLPAEAQTVFADWKTKAEARREMDSAIHAIADKFITQAPSAPVPSQD